MEDLPPHIESIVRAATAAPSGDNSQPWHFVFKAPNVLDFHYHPELDHPILNIDDSGTLIALGAAIENAVLESKFQGYTPTVTLHPVKDNSHIASIELKEDGEISVEESLLQQAIHTRHSNRKAYRRSPLETKAEQTLLKQMHLFPDLELVFIQDPEKMLLFARNLTTMEEIALSNKYLHKLFFKSIFWSNAKHEKGEPGLHGKTLELPPPAQALFRILKFWFIAGFFASLGFPAFVAKTNAEQNASAAAFGAILSKHLDSETYISAGRLLERIWLQATTLGLSFQIVSGILFLTRSIEQHKDENLFSNSEKTLALEANKEIHTLLEAGEYHPIITFRIGYGPKVSARSKRMKARVEVVH